MLPTAWSSCWGCLSGWLSFTVVWGGGQAYTCHVAHLPQEGEGSPSSIQPQAFLGTSSQLLACHHYFPGFPMTFLSGVSVTTLGKMLQVLLEQRTLAPAASEGSACLTSQKGSI